MSDLNTRFRIAATEGMFVLMVNIVELPPWGFYHCVLQSVLVPDLGFVITVHLFRGP